MSGDLMTLTSIENKADNIDADLFQSIEGIVFHLDANCGIVSINPFAAAFFGLSAGENEGKAFFGTLAPIKNSSGKNQPELFENYLRTPEKEGAFECEVFTADGQLKGISLASTIFYDSHGEIKGISCIGIDRRECAERGRQVRNGIDTLESFLAALKMMDVESDESGFGFRRSLDGKKKAEIAIAEKEREFRFCIENAQVLLTVTDENGVIRRINKAGARLYGREPEEMIGHIFTEFVPEFERERVFRTFKRDFKKALMKKDARTVGMGGNINKIKSKEGLRDILFYKTGIKVYKDGCFEGILNTAADITDVVKAREELKRHQEQLEQLVAERSAELQCLQEEKISRERLTALGKMADVVSQEIRTPLSTISNSLFVIQERLKDKEIGVKKSIERANRAIRRCYSIVYEFKEFTQNDELKKVPIDIDSWLNTLIDEIDQTGNVSIERDIKTGVITNIDPERMKRAVLCMIENSRQALAEMEDGRLIIRSKHSFNRLEIEIEDNGPGIPQDTLEKIFEPLFSTRSFGLGLGMSICRQILQAHGGGVSIESREKSGTKVLLWVPVETWIHPD